MNQIEDRVKPVLIPMIQDMNPRSLSLEGQRRLAIWGFKTTLTLLATQPANVRPPLDLYRGFRQHGYPPVPMWAGAADVDNTVRYDVQVGTHNESPTPDVPDFIATRLVIGRVFIGSNYPVNPALRIEYKHPLDTFFPIWPARQIFVWPPPKPVDTSKAFRPIE